MFDITIRLTLPLTDGFEQSNFWTRDEKLPFEPRAGLFLGLDEDEQQIEVIVREVTWLVGKDGAGYFYLECDLRRWRGEAWLTHIRATLSSGETSWKLEE